MTESRPNIKLLRDIVHIDFNDDVPLHSQLRQGLSLAIENYFENGQRFFNEKELIENLNLSQVTVRRALSDLAREGMLERRVAKGSFVRKEGGTKNVTGATLIAPDWDSSFIVSLIRECSLQCQTVGVRTDMLLTQQGGSIVSVNGSSERDLKTNGILLIGNEPSVTLNLYQRYSPRQRVINIDAWSENYPGPYVGTSMQEVTRIGLDHLQSLGHSVICLLVNEPEYPGGNVTTRIQSFVSDCEKRGLPHCKVVHCGTKYWETHEENVFKKMPEIMALAPKPTAIFTFDDIGAWAALKWLNQQGIRVPEDISVIGFSDDRPSRYTHPALTTIAHPIQDIAKKAVELLCVKRLSSTHHFLTPKLVIRESTAPVHVPSSV